MALIKEIPTKYWVTAEYHRIVLISINAIDKKADVYLASYADKDTRMNESEALETSSYTFENLDTAFFGANLFGNAYDQIKLEDERFEDAIDDIDTVDFDDDVDEE